MSNASACTFTPPLYSGETLYTKSSLSSGFGLERKSVSTHPESELTVKDEEYLPSSPLLQKQGGDRLGSYVAVPRNAKLPKDSQRLFERPHWLHLALFATLCGAVYPFFILVSKIASNRSIFWARAIVGAGSGLLGLSLAILLLGFSRRYLEASTWATLIHMSRDNDGDVQSTGILLRDLSRQTHDSISIFSALGLLKTRWINRTTLHSAQKSYDRRPWSLCILFFLFLVVLCSSLSFIFGRIVTINMAVALQHDTFDEVLVWGDLGVADIEGAKNLESVFAAFVQTWTLAPFASLTDLPSAVAFEFENDTVYFAQSYANQLRVDGVGFGTFDLTTFATTAASNAKNVALTDGTVSDNQSSELVQFPKWGIRIHCEKLPEPETYLTPVSADGFTYIFVPDFILKDIFAKLSIAYPDLPAANLTNVLSANDSVPAGVDASTIIVAGQFSNNGVAHSYMSSPTDLGPSGNGWTEIEVLLVRVNETYTPNGTFPVHGGPVPDETGAETFVGYDSAVCVETYEAWIVETYNTTGAPPSSTRIVRRGADIPDSDTDGSGAKRTHKLSSGGFQVQRSLNSTGKTDAFEVAHDNSINQMIKDNGRDFFYVPSPLLVSFTNGYGPSGYTKLSATRYAAVRAAADATNVLPFLAGRGALVARSYPSHILAVVCVPRVPMLITTSLLLVIGVIAGLCVPSLPLAVPRRRFDLLSWLAVLHGDNMIGQLPILPGRQSGIDEKMTLEDIDSRLGDVRVRYNI